MNVAVIFLVLLIPVFGCQPLVPNHIEQVGHTKATQHIVCYSGGKVIYNAFVTNLDKDRTFAGYKFVRDDTGITVRTNAPCVVEE